jgi:hypothetical protein
MPAQNTQLMEQIGPYWPWLISAGVFVLFALLRFTRQALRRRVDAIGYRLMRERGLLIWFWINAPGVMIHELSHAFVVLLFSPFGFRITSITLFRIRQMAPRTSNGRSMRKGAQSLQLGEVQYVRPQGRFMSYVGDGFSGIAPLFGGIAAFIFFYWVATGYQVWEFNGGYQHLQLLRPGWPWWTLIFAPYLILTITSELWPSRQDWKGARWFVAGLLLLVVAVTALLWYTNNLTTVVPVLLFIAERVDFALLILLGLDVVFLLFAEAIVRVVQH